MALKRAATIALFAAAALLTLASIIVAAHVETPRVAGTDPTTTPSPTEPPGIVVPLGRYEEPRSVLPLLDAQSAPPSLISNANAPAATTGFAGVGQEIDGNSFIHSPPDTHAAAGPDRIVEVTNGHVAIYAKTGAVIAGGDTGAGAVDLDTFCGNDCYDPKVIYDQESERFVAVALEGRQSSESFLHIMVSHDSSPSDLTTDWDKFRHASDANITGPGWFDYPGLGVSPDAVVVSGNIFRNVGGLSVGTKLRIFDKADLYDGDAVATFVDIDSDVASGGSTIQPTHHFGSPSPGVFYLLQRWNPTLLRLVALTGVPSSPTVDATFLVTSDQGPCVDVAPQQGTGNVLDTVCPRMMNAVWRDGSVWGTLAGSDATDSRTVVQWFEIETNNYAPSTPTLRQHGAIDGGAGEFTFLPAISVDSCGNAALTYTQSSASRFPEMRYTGRLAGDPLNTMQSPVVAKASTFFFDDFTGLPDEPSERWGDYSATAIDPSDQSFWIAHEYARVAASVAENDGRWGTWIANFTFGCGGPAQSPTPASTETPTPTPTLGPVGGIAELPDAEGAALDADGSSAVAAAALSGIAAAAAGVVVFAGLTWYGHRRRR